MTQSSILFTSSSVYRAPIFEVAPYFHNGIYFGIITGYLPTLFAIVTFICDSASRALNIKFTVTEPFHDFRIVM
jgi:hypothetical protein